MTTHLICVYWRCKNNPMISHNGAHKYQLRNADGLSYCCARFFSICYVYLLSSMVWEQLFYLNDEEFGMILWWLACYPDWGFSCFSSLCRITSLGLYTPRPVTVSALYTATLTGWYRKRLPEHCDHFRSVMRPLWILVIPDSSTRALRQ
jgi:hypothetical protein